MVNKLFCSLLLLLLTGTAFGQTPTFKGKIVFEYNYSDVPLEMMPKMMMSTDKEILQISGDTWAIDQISKAGSRKIFSGYHVDSIQVFASYFTFKAHLTFGVKDTSMFKRPVVKEIKYFNKTKKIAGIDCSLASVLYEGADKPMPVYFAPSIPNTQHIEFEGLKGLPMMYTRVFNGITVLKKAIEIAELDADWNKNPTGYKRMSTDELKSKFDGF